MLEELLQEITACENLAQENIRKANVEAKDILVAADAKVSEINIATVEKIKKLKADNIANAEAKALEICNDIIANGYKDAELAKQKAKDKEDKIINDIVGRISKKYANG